MADTLTKPIVGHLVYQLNNIMMGWLKLWPAQSIRVKGVSWKNRGFGIGVAVEDSDRVSERKILGSLKRKEGFTKRKKGILQ